jgi:hypothetical protein
MKTASGVERLRSGEGRGSTIGLRLLGVLLLVAAAGGLFIEGLYRDARSVAAMFRGYDFVSLVVVAPLLIIASLQRFSSSLRVRTFVLGVTAYTVYTYAFYLFGATFNDFLLIHVAIFTAAMATLFHGVERSEPIIVAIAFGHRTRGRIVAAILAGLGVSLGAMWIAGSLGFIFTGDVPTEASKLVLPTGLTHLGYVMDLSILIPSYMLGAVLIWRRNAWGYVLAAISLVAGVLHQVSYMTAMIFQVRADVPGATALDPVEPIILAIYLAGLWLLFAKRTSAA